MAIRSTAPVLVHMPGFWPAQIERHQMHTDGILGAAYYGWRLDPLARPHDVSQETAISVRAQVNSVVEELNTLALMR